MNRRDMLKLLGITGAAVITPEARSQLMKEKIDLAALRIRPNDSLRVLPEKVDAIIDVMGRIIDTIGGLEPLE